MIDSLPLILIFISKSQQSISRMKLLIFLIPLLSFTVAFHSPFDRSVSLPYGRQLRAVLSGKIAIERSDSEELSWWEGLDRNNTIDCKCGQFTTTDDPEDVDKWSSEGVKVLNEYPWSVSLVSSGESQTYAFCGGTLISDRFVLTSAVCADGFQGGDLDVLIGTWPRAHLAERNVTTDEAEVKTLEDADVNTRKLIRKKVHRVIVHPKYSSNVLDYNIALLRLKGPVPTYGTKDGITPVCLPEVNFDYNGMESTSLLWRFYNGEGYIIPEKRSEVDSKILSKEDCKGLNYNREWAMMPDLMLCASMEIPPNIKNHPYYDAYDCPGDAGGGLFVTINGRKVQVGIDSWTACYGRPKGVGVFTRVQEFLKWIKLHITEDGRHCAY